jgi:hypothetical protein
MVALLAILSILAAFLLLRRSRGANYPVVEQARRQAEILNQFMAGKVDATTAVRRLDELGLPSEDIVIGWDTLAYSAAVVQQKVRELEQARRRSH